MLQVATFPYEINGKLNPKTNGTLWQEICAYRLDFCKRMKWTTGFTIFETTLLGANGEVLEGEFDKFDTKETVYVFSRNSDGKINATTRFMSTENYMLEDPYFTKYPGFIDIEKLPKQHDKCCEASRTFWDGHPKLRMELVVAFFELGRQLEIEAVVGMMSQKIIMTFFGKAGCTLKSNRGEPSDISYLGQPTNMKDPGSDKVDEEVTAIKLRISTEGEDRVRNKCGIPGNILYIPDEDNYTRERFPNIQVESQIVNILPEFVKNSICQRILENNRAR